MSVNVMQLICYSVVAKEREIANTLYHSDAKDTLLLGCLLL